MWPVVESTKRGRKGTRRGVVRLLLMLLLVSAVSRAANAPGPASQGAKCDPEAQQNCVSAVVEKSAYVTGDTKVKVPPSDVAGSTSVSDSSGIGILAVNFSPGIAAVKENVFVSNDNLFRIVAAEPALSVSTYAPGNFMIAPVPVPEQTMTHRFFDRENLIGMAVHAAVRTADAVQTCTMLGRGAREAWLPMKGCAGITAYSLAMVPAQIGNAYLLHRTGHHKLERWMPYVWAAPSAAGIAYSMRTW